MNRSPYRQLNLGTLLGLAVLSLGCGSLHAQPALPSWGNEEPNLVPRLWPGNPMWSPLEIPAPPPEPVKFEIEMQLPPEVDPTVLPEVHLADYFGTLPETYLVDPQTLLTGDERTNINLTLKQHLSQHKVPIYILLFQKEQQIPPFQSLERLHDRWFDGRPGVIVAFWLDSPSRTSANFGSYLREHFGDQLDQAFAKALEQSYTKSYPFSQLDHFIYTLLWRLSRLEEGAANSAARPADFATRDPLAVPELPEIPEHSWVPIVARSSALAVGVAALGAGIVVRLRRRDRLRSQPRPVCLPDGPRAERLEAPHSGGSGAVIRITETPHRSAPTAQTTEIPS